MRFLELHEVLHIHHDQITRYGGTLGVRDMGLLTSAIAMPTATFKGDFLHTDIHEMAAAYLFHLVRSCPFLDGNKRVGAVSAIVFLALNGYDFEAPEDDLVEMVCGVARSELEKTDVALFMRMWSGKR
ncbi:type II toxin-antitoxin system death-on-curing family toxin [Chlorobaculum sp. MV4-Y]|uniref:type II toxin-antitoxin system death-on-curing family toxin n=1 Tax=Chlorobaculum sp. MV4-Y TaxID=2976335 RepID=UPI0021AF3FB1|nr:type II toxin-antitoxin system death-on-curing family toxin [Chlorobaculum sp. MV4-Y]UWX58711.1 type II toxin-antitoxin system death-on-curing family toxin [Chlorobaculum sp. MV4-Y]